MPTKDQVIEIIKTIEDPDIFLDIWFLGLIYHIDIQEDKITIEMTFTTPLCPSGPQLVAEVKEKVGKLEDVKEVQVNVTFNPPWQPSDEVKSLLGLA
jgi:metal-sulfur cluster biosynthetic enzyme